MPAEEIEQELLKLPAAERARIAERLIASLDEDAELERAWLEEVRRRDREIESGEVDALPLEDALRSARSRLGW
jgi:putative addiction module component (TIGR02574 family)